jgi:hypothetical protein
LNYLLRQAEVIARDTRQMKHIFVVKQGSIMIWKRLDPDGRVPKLSKHDFDQMDDEKSLPTFFFWSKKKLFNLI